jgi:hypothetical protein
MLVCGILRASSISHIALRRSRPNRVAADKSSSAVSARTSDAILCVCACVRQESERETCPCCRVAERGEGNVNAEHEIRRHAHDKYAHEMITQCAHEILRHAHEKHKIKHLSV